MDEDRGLQGQGEDRGGIDTAGWLDAAAHAYNRGQDIWPLLTRRHPEPALIALELIQQRAAEQDHQARRDGAVMTGNAVNGARSVDGRPSGNTSSTNSTA